MKFSNRGGGELAPGAPGSRVSRTNFDAFPPRFTSRRSAPRDAPLRSVGMSRSERLAREEYSRVIRPRDEEWV